MTDRPITFSAPMIHALLDGRKTQTRQILRPKGVAKECGYTELALNVLVGHLLWWDGVHERVGASQPFPSYPGDRLWVKEAWRAEARYDALRPSELPADALIYYEAEGPAPSWVGRHRHARFMPRWASRLTLIVTDVRVQRVQDISEADARAEASWLVRCDCAAMRPTKDRTPISLSFRQTWCHIHGQGFSTLWNSIHGPDAWDRNDWVAALTFSVHRKNIKEMAND